jgi:hypothetical protein
LGRFVRMMVLVGKLTHLHLRAASQQAVAY